MSESRLRIAEIFESLQGEGSRLGVPSLFIRVSGCNLRCIWCDTPYASWKPEGPIESIEAILERAGQSRCEDVVLTGGEPMLFEGIIPLAEGLKAMGKKITIETAGTVFRKLPADLMSISPKLSSSTPTGTQWEESHERIRHDLEPLNQLAAAYHCQLKFVVQPQLEGDPDQLKLKREIAEIDEVLKAVPNIPADQIYLMPEGRSQEALWKSARLLVPICLERGWRLAPRIQIDLFGDTRGT